MVSKRTNPSSSGELRFLLDERIVYPTIASAHCVSHPTADSRSHPVVTVKNCPLLRIAALTRS